MATNIGLNVIEVDGTAAAPIQGAAVSVGAFNVLTRRGVPNRPVRVTSFTEFGDRFGGFDSGGFGAYLVKGFFDNGGQRAYVNRVAGAGANAPTPAVATISQSSANNAPALLGLEGGFRGQSDPGAWADGVQVTLAPSFAAGVKQGATVAKDGTALDRVAGFALGDTALVQNGTHRAIVTIAQLDPATGAIKWAPDLPDPGDFTADGTAVSSTDFDLAVTRPGEAQPAETWTRLTLLRGATNYAVTTLNDQARGSKLVKASDPRAANVQAVPDTPGIATTVTLGGGADGTTASSDFIGDEGARTGFRRVRPARHPARLHRAHRSGDRRSRPGLLRGAGRLHVRRSRPGGLGRRRHRDRVRCRLPGQEGVRRALRAVDLGLRPARPRADPDQADPADRARDGRLRPDRVDARHLQGPGGRRRTSRSAHSTSSTS